MSDKIRAADELKRFGRQMANILDLVDELERIGSIENAAKEAEINFNRSKSTLESIKSQIEESKSKLKLALEDEENHAARIKAEVEQASQQAKDIIDSAVLEANNMQSDTKRILSDLKHEIGVVRGDISNLNKTKMAITNEIESLTQRKETAMAEARKLFGA